MSEGFVHSVKVPRLYKSAAKIVREVRSNGGSVQNLIYEQRHPNVSALYSLCVNCLQRETLLNVLITNTQILLNEPRLDPWLARIFITELLWGKKSLNTDCKPAKTVLSYEKRLQDALIETTGVETPQPPKKTVRKPRYVRINTLLLPEKKEVFSSFKEEGWCLLPKCTTYSEYLTTVKKLSNSDYIQDFHVPELLVFPPKSTFHDHYGYQNGELILQDKASCLPAQFLNPEPGSTVLDMCAAPGMKTSHIAALMENKGKVYAVEINPARYKTLCEQVSLTEASCVETINEDALTLARDKYSDVDYILVDPSCSGSGMLVRKLMSDGNEECTPHRLKQLQSFQVFLLRQALLNFPKVKRVVYSTCSIYPEENEQVVDEVLENVQGAYKLRSLKDELGDNWLHYSSKEYKCADKCLYAKSEVDLCNGFFVAVFERDFDVPLPKYGRKPSKQQTTEEKAEENNELGSKKTKPRRTKKKRAKRKSKAQEGSTMNDSTVSYEFIKIVDGTTRIRPETDDEEPPKKKKKAVKKDENQDADAVQPPLKKKSHKIDKKEIMKKNAVPLL